MADFTGLYKMLQTAANCCFRVASLMLFKTEQNHLELRVRTIVELAKYSFFYLTEGEVINRMEAEMAILNAKALTNCWVTLSSSLSKNVLNNRLKIGSLLPIFSPWRKPLNLNFRARNNWDICLNFWFLSRPCFFARTTWPEMKNRERPKN